jgi:hypothetical protein
MPNPMPKNAAAATVITTIPTTIHMAIHTTTVMGDPAAGG